MKNRIELWGKGSGGPYPERKFKSEKLDSDAYQWRVGRSDEDTSAFTQTQVKAPVQLLYVMGQLISLILTSVSSSVNCGYQHLFYRCEEESDEIWKTPRKRLTRWKCSVNNKNQGFLEKLRHTWALMAVKKTSLWLNDNFCNWEEEEIMNSASFIATVYQVPVSSWQIVGDQYKIFF